MITVHNKKDLKKYKGFVKYEFVGRSGIAHRTTLKTLINPILRYFQFWTDKPYVIMSEVDDSDPDNLKFIRYRIGRMKYYE